MDVMSPFGQAVGKVYGLRLRASTDKRRYYDQQFHLLSSFTSYVEPIGPMTPNIIIVLLDTTAVHSKSPGQSKRVERSWLPSVIAAPVAVGPRKPA